MLFWCDGISARRHESHIGLAGTEENKARICNVRIHTGISWLVLTQNISTTFNLKHTTAQWCRTIGFWWVPDPLPGLNNGTSKFIEHIQKIVGTTGWFKLKYHKKSCFPSTISFFIYHGSLMFFRLPERPLTWPMFENRVLVFIRVQTCTGANAD